MTKAFTLTAAAIPERVAAILRMYDGDPETAHAFEDDLLHAAVLYVAAEKPAGVEDESQAICRAIEPLLAADRTRWCA